VGNKGLQTVYNAGYLKYTIVNHNYFGFTEIKKGDQCLLFLKSKWKKSPFINTFFLNSSTQQLKK